MNNISQATHLRQTEMCATSLQQILGDTYYEKDTCSEIKIGSFQLQIFLQRTLSCVC